MTNHHHCSQENAAKFLSWIKQRGGIFVWQSINLSNPGASWSTPATIRFDDCEHHGNIKDLIPLCPRCRLPIRQENAPADKLLLHCTTCSKDIGDSDFLVAYPKPNWQCGNEPSRIITDPAEVMVDGEPVEYKRFHVALQKASGMQIKLTPASSDRVHKHMRECKEKHGDAWRQFDYESQECVIYYAAKPTPLNEWKP